MRINKKRLVKNQEGFSEHVDLKENPGLDFDRLTIGCDKHLHYLDDGKNKRDKKIKDIDWGGDPWKAKRTKRPLVRDQEGFSEHVDLEENPGLDFDSLTTGSNEHLHYVDDGKNKRDKKIKDIDWGGDPWKAKRTKRPLVRDQKGFSEHVDPKENPGLDFDSLTTGSHEHLQYVDDGKNIRDKIINSMDWDGNPWKAEIKRPLVRDQKGFSEHVDPEENPGLDFDSLTTGSGEHLHYVDDGKNIRDKIVYNMDWGGNPWKVERIKRPLVRDQKGFSEHVDLKENPGLNFDRLTTGSDKYLHYVDDGKNKRFRKIYKMDWDGNPWRAEIKRPLVRDQKGFSEHVDPEENPGLDFNSLTTGSNEHLHYVDDGKNIRDKIIYSMDWGGDPWMAERIKRPLVRDQEGFSEHVDLKGNPGLDFDSLTTGSSEHLHYVDDGKNIRDKIIYSMDWGGDPWKAERIKRPLVRDQKGFSEHVDPEENPGLDFDSLTTGSHEHLHYVDDGKNIRDKIVNSMDWGGNPWKAKRTKRPLVRDQKGFSEHVDPEENPGLDFDSLTTGSNEHLHYVDDGKNIRDKIINSMDWDGNPWKAERIKRPLVRDQKGFSEHVDLKENPGLDFDSLTIGSGEHLHYVDDRKNKRHREICQMDWGGDPWKAKRTKRPLVCDQKGFSEHVDLKGNPGLDFDSLTIGSGEHLHYVDDGKNKRHREIRQMDWGGNPWKAERIKRPLVRDQEGFSEHVDLKENPGLDFDSLTTGSQQHLHYVDDGKNKRHREICQMDWGGNPWKAKRTKRPLVRDQEGFSEHVDLKGNPGLDFDSLTTGSHEHLHYVDDGKNIRDKIVNSMDWGGNPWKAERIKKPLVRDQEGFSEHVDLEENPGLDFNSLTTGSYEHLHYVDDMKRKRYKRICNFDWDGNPWKPATKKPLVRDQKGFSKHVDLKENPGLDFDSLTTGSHEHLQYVDEGGNKRNRFIHNMDWGGNPWKGDNKDELVGEDPGFWNHCDETDPCKISSIKKLHKMSKYPVKMHCDEGHHYPTILSTYFSDMKNDCPYCAERMTIQGETDAVTADPELEKFFIKAENSIDIHRVGAKTGHYNLKWKCPLCGYRFKKSLQRMVNCHPKCKMCRDTGIIELPELNETKFPHIIIVRGEKRCPK